LIYPLIGHSKTRISEEKNNKLVFEWPIRGVNQNKNILQGVNQKKYFTECKTGNDLYYRGGKALLTLKKITMSIREN
jgi:hypothetical protein